MGRGSDGEGGQDMLLPGGEIWGWDSRPSMILEGRESKAEGQRVGRP